MVARQPARQLFLKWVLANALLAVFVIILGIEYHSRVQGATLLVVPIILGIYVYANVGAGRICWRADGVEAGTQEADRLLHEAKWLDHWAWIAQMLGILSTLAGFFLLLTGGGSNADLHERIIHGGGLALIGTFVGVLVSKVLKHTQRMVEHELEQ